MKKKKKARGIIDGAMESITGECPLTEKHHGLVKTKEGPHSLIFMC